MSAALLLRPGALLRTGAARAGLAGASFARGKATLPELSYSYSALEPTISTAIMTLHHSKHHQTYVTSFNAASDQLSAATAAGDIQAQIALQPLLNFHGGGHVNHSLFWENLAPAQAGGGDASLAGGGRLAEKIQERWGGVGALKAEMEKALAGVQGSGWAWLVLEKDSGRVAVQTRANQDPVVGNFVPLLGIDAWEHAYYLQYQNRKADYFKAIWDVINWKAAEDRLAKA